jgi:hypothetical protein
MFVSRCQSRIGKVTAVAATFILPIATYAASKPVSVPPHVPIVPETNSLWVLIPIAAAAMLFAARRFAQRKG